MKYKFKYSIYTVDYTFEGDEIIKRAYNGLRAYVKKHWDYMMSVMDKPRYEICEYDDNYAKKAIDGGFCKSFIE